MKKFTFSFLSIFTFGLYAFSASAQTVVSESTIARQAENTAPTKNWVAYTRNGGTINFVQGPGTSPLGCGSAQFNTPTGADKAFLFNYDHNGTALSAITALTYKTYRTSGNPIQVAALNIEIDINGAAEGGRAILVFEPGYNLNQGPIADNTWQTWDAFKNGNAVWWTSQPINGACASSCYVTWNDILANNPQATIAGGFGVNQGSGNAGLQTAVDALTIGIGSNNTIYNFESTNTFYRDADNDGYGDPNPANSITANCPPAGYVTNNTDCDDTKDTKYPGRGCGPANIATFTQSQSGTGNKTTLAYPNPTTGEVNVQLQNLNSTEAEIITMNAGGAIIGSRKVNANGQTEKLNLSGNGPGFYLIKVVSQAGVEVIKVAVQ